MPIIKHKEQRIGVFIDVQNLYHSARNIYKARVNFKEVLKTAVSNRKLIRAIAYGIKTESGEESGFFDALTRMNIEVKMKDLQIFYGGAKKGDWDVGIAVDAIKFAPYLDAVILITGDGDFIPLVEFLKSHGQQVEVISFSKSTSGKLIESADEFTDLCETPDKYLIKQTKKK